VLRKEKAEIVVDEKGKTSFDGIWAAGDVNNLWGEQIVIAAGEGAKTALAIVEHIAKLPHQATSNIHEG
jgi:alkyl hydroperoxide reductase subunit F